MPATISSHHEDEDNGRDEQGPYPALEPEMEPASNQRLSIDSANVVNGQQVRFRSHQYNFVTPRSDSTSRRQLHQTISYASSLAGESAFGQNGQSSLMQRRAQAVRSPSPIARSSSPSPLPQSPPLPPPPPPSSLPRSPVPVTSPYSESEYGTANNELDFDTRPMANYPLTNEDGPSQRAFGGQELEDLIGLETLVRLTVATLQRPETIAAAMQPNGRVRAAMFRLSIEGLGGLDNAIDVLRTELAPPDVSPAYRW